MLFVGKRWREIARQLEFMYGRLDCLLLLSCSFMEGNGPRCVMDLLIIDGGKTEEERRESPFKTSERTGDKCLLKVRASHIVFNGLEKR